MGWANFYIYARKFNVRLRWRWIAQSLRQAQGSYKVGEPVEPLVSRLAIPFRGSNHVS